jgi:hypothetical protein
MAVNEIVIRSGRRVGVSTRTLLLTGAVAPPAFIATFTVEGALRAGYDPIRHFVSLLSLGDGGLVQVATFILGGLLFAAFGVGLRRRWPRTGAPGRVPQLVILVGGALVACGVFVADPALGYPPGTPPGIPTEISWHGGLHYLGALVVFLGLASAIAISARSAPIAASRRWAAYSLASAAIVLGGWLGAFLLTGPSGIVEQAGLLQRVAVVAGFQWLTATALIELRKDS